MESRRERAKSILFDVLERPAAERDAFVQEACGGDAELEAEVRGLLGAHDSAPTWSEDAFHSWKDELEPGARLASYTLVEELGAGGFGTVWRAVQDEPVRREVALKVIRAGLDTREVVARFETERQALAMMEHPCIARVYAGGTTPRGRPWLAMELVDGAPITEFCDARGVPTRQRLGLFVDVCRAVQHAHQKGIIHRDLKPSNVLVTEVDGAPMPKVIDFGIAKAASPEASPNSFATRGGQMVGTPAYMSPEQIDGSTDVDTRTDVYALGILLYELLAGEPPFDEDTRTPEGLLRLAQAIREVPPERPSTRAGRARRSADSTPSHPETVHVRHLKGDLDWIVLKCLEKERARRYSSVEALARDLERHLADEPVEAGPPDLGYRARKFVTRHRAALLVAAGFLALLVGGLVTSLGQLRRARLAERTSTTELNRFREIAGFLEGLLSSLDPAIAQGRDVTVIRDALDRSTKAADEAQDSEPVVEATLRRVLGRAYLALAVPDEAERNLKRALELREEARGPDHAETLESLDDWAYFKLATADFDGAEEPLERAYAGHVALHGERDPRTLETWVNLGILRNEQGRYDEAIQHPVRGRGDPPGPGRRGRLRDHPRRQQPGPRAGRRWPTRRSAAAVRTRPRGPARAPGRTTSRLAQGAQQLGQHVHRARALRRGPRDAAAVAAREARDPARRRPQPRHHDGQPRARAGASGPHRRSRGALRGSPRLRPRPPGRERPQDPDPAVQPRPGVPAPGTPGRGEVRVPRRARPGPGSPGAGPTADARRFGIRWGRRYARPEPPARRRPTHAREAADGAQRLYPPGHPLPGPVSG